MNEILNIRETLNRAQDQGIPISEAELCLAGSWAGLI